MAAEASVRRWKNLVMNRRQERIELQDGAEMKEKAKQFRGIHTAHIIFKKRDP
jgi:hypothetical protein